MADLPLVDEFSTLIAAGPASVWPVLLETLDELSSRAAAVGCARAVGCADRTASGSRPLTVGSTIPGFRVVSAVPERQLALEGSHRFSSYALVFRLEEMSGERSRLRAQTRATFPGPAGGLYRRLVIGTGGHELLVRRLLAGIKRRSESDVSEP